MKKLITLLFCFSAIVVKGQFPVNSYLGSDSTAIIVRGGETLKMLQIPNYSDTSSAVGPRVKQYSGSLIFVGDSLYYRNAAKDTWLKVGSGSGTTYTAGAFNNTSTAKGFDITGSVISLHSADATNPGSMSTGTQAFAGAKTFNAAASFLSTVDVTSDVTVSSAGSFKSQGSGSNRGIKLYSFSGLDNLANVTAYPYTGTNVGATINLIPRGTGFSSTIKSQLSFYNTDYIADATNWDNFTIRGTGSEYAFFNGNGGSGTLRPMYINATGQTTAATCNIYFGTNSYVGINTTTPANNLDVLGNINVGTGLSSGGRSIIRMEDRGGYAAASNASMKIYPVGGGNTAQSLGVVPSGTGSSATYQSGLALFNTPFMTDAVNWELGVWTGSGSIGYVMGSYANGTGVKRPLIFDAGVNVSDHTNPSGAKQLYLSTTGPVGINQLSPNASAQLDIASTTKGMLIPRMTTTQRDAVSTPATSLLIYNSTTGQFEWYNGSSWVAISNGNTIYTGDGTLGGNRTVNMANHTLYFNTPAGVGSQFAKLASNNHLSLIVDSTIHIESLYYEQYTGGGNDIYFSSGADIDLYANSPGGYINISSNGGASASKVYSVASSSDKYDTIPNKSGTFALVATHNITTPATGGTVTLVKDQYNIINPAAGIATLTVAMPATPANNDVVYVKFTKAVTTVTYSVGTVSDGIVSPTAGTLMILTYDSGTTTWY